MSQIEWEQEARETLRQIIARYNLNPARALVLERESEAWARRRMADDDDKGYDDEPRVVVASDVGYSWSYLMLMS